jgi:signal transduction histidine kinase
MITLPSEICTGLYRIAQEAIQNALKHSRAGRIQVSVQNTQAELWLSIADNGCGIQFDCLNNSGMGISNMHHRASRIGANLCIEKQDRGGTLVKCYLPLSVIPEKGELCHAAVE